VKTRTVTWPRSRSAIVALTALLLCCIIAYVIYARILFPTLDRAAGSPEEALRPVWLFPPDIRDDHSMRSLEKAIENNLTYLSRLDPNHLFHYGDITVPCSRVLEAQKALLSVVAARPSPKALARSVEDGFELYRATGRKGNRHVLYTGYFEPVYEGSLSPDDQYRHPLYRTPRDLIRIDLSSFGPEFEGKRITARIVDGEVRPYYTRREIEQEGVLRDRGLELLWMKDPVDVAFLHIQGSGRIILPNGDFLSVGYGGANGRPYRSIGRYLIDLGRLTREEMSMQAIRRFLDENPEMRDDTLNHNPSYVFFTRKENGPFGNINVPLTPERSIALDDKLFPKGALCYITAKKPVVQDNGILEWEGMTRLMVNQDTGGAIRGAGRADIFWGSGPYAELAAGHMKHEGDLYVLLPKQKQ